MKIKTGLILCAGFGKRVQPITDTLPKPLIVYKNITLLENTISILIGDIFVFEKFIRDFKFDPLPEIKTAAQTFLPLNFFIKFIIF